MRRGQARQDAAARAGGEVVCRRERESAGGIGSFSLCSFFKRAEERESVSDGAAMGRPVRCLGWGSAVRSCAGARPTRLGRQSRRGGGADTVRRRYRAGKGGRPRRMTSTEKFSAGEVVAAQRTVEREMEAAARAIPIVVVAGVVAAVLEPATTRLAAKLLLVVLLVEGNREAAVEATAMPAPPPPPPELLPLSQGQSCL